MKASRYDYFISYCHLDRELVEVLAQALEERGKRVWWDSHLVGAARDWREEVADAIHDSTTVLVVLSERSAGRREVRREMQYAEESAGKRLVPLIVGDPSGN